MSSSEEEEGKDETSLPSSPSDERRWKASLPASKERREVAADKEVEQSMQVNNCFSFNPVTTGERGGQLENMVVHLMALMLPCFSFMLPCYSWGLQHVSSQTSSTFKEERVVLALKQWSSVSVQERLVVIRKSSASKCKGLSKAWKR